MEKNAEYNYAKLTGRTAELGLTSQKVAVAAGMTPTTYCIKLGNRGEFKQNEIVRIMDVLKIDAEDVGLYFFCTESSV
jgi:hypothetical protein